jgi:hypothetical protein
MMTDDILTALTAALTDTGSSVDKLNLTPNLLAGIARDIATNIRELPDILLERGITEDQYKTQIEPNSYFQSVLQTYVREWESIGSTKMRIILQAQFALEDKLPVLAGRMSHPNEDLADVATVAKFLKELAGVGPAATNAPSEAKERFSIQIVIGDRSVAIEAKEPQKLVEEKLLELPSETAPAKDSIL